MTDTPLVLAAEHPAFEGHFPGRPNLPAVVLLAEALAVVQAQTRTTNRDWTVAQAKFPRGVIPGTALTLAREALASGGIRFEIRSPEGVVANGTFARVAGTA